MTGCLKSGQPTNRIFESKYFTPIEFYEPALLPNYFAGAGYFMNRETLQKLIKIKEQVPIIHLDDVYIGKLIKAADLQDTMLQGMVWHIIIKYLYLIILPLIQTLFRVY